MKRVACLLLLAAAGCGGNEQPGLVKRDPGPIVRADGEPDRVMYYQILIAFHGAKGDLNTTRTKSEASVLAHTLKQRLAAGEKFIELMNEYSDDRAPDAGHANGPYIACNIGVAHRARPDLIPEVPRANLERAVGDTVFSLSVNEARLLAYDREFCPWGWHLLWRVK